MRIVDRLDPVALERELLERVDAAHPLSEPGATLIVVPTARLADHLMRRLGTVRPAWLGLDVLEFNRLAGEILRRHTGRPLRIASDRVLAALVEQAVRERPATAWSRFARRRPGTLGRLQATLTDLREAGIDPSVLTRCCPSDDRASGIADLYETYSGALEQWTPSGWTDSAGRVRAATEHAAAFCSRHRAVFVHGAYEWNGVNLDLLREIDQATDLTVLVPARFGTRVSSFAERFFKEYVPGSAGAQPTEDHEVTESGSLRLDALYVEESRPAPVDASRIDFAHAQGAAAEVEFAVRCALRDVAQGSAPTEIAIVARSLSAYAPALEQALEDAGLPWTSPLSTPLRRQRLAQEFLLLLRVVDEEFPRQATAALFRSPRIDWSGAAGLEPPPADRIDSWSRQAKLLGGIEDWTVELPRWAAEPQSYPGQRPERREAAAEVARKRVEGVERIVTCVNGLIREVEPAARTWGEHAERSRSLLGTFFGREAANDASGSYEAMERLFDEMTLLESLVGDGGPIEFATMRAWLDQATDASELKPFAKDGGGIRVLDAMQLRGLTFDNVYILGMNSGLFPRAPREDPILGDTARAEIAAASAKPLGRKLEAGEEERLLLALLLGSARNRVSVSWQRADESGKAATPSLALRELARLRFGVPDLDRLRSAARHLPSHPTQALQAMSKDPGLLSRDEEMLLAVLSTRDPSRAENVRERFPRLGPGLAMLQETQAWTPGSAMFDGRVGALDRDPSISVSALESLGGCPLRYFFESVLRVTPQEDETDPLTISDRDAGTEIHALLERLYRQLADEGLFEQGADLVERGRELLARNDDHVLGDLGRRLSVRLPFLWREKSRTWAAALDVMVRSDLARIAGLGLRPSGFEETCRKPIDLGDDTGVTLSARFDRRLEGPDGEIVGDYKTSKSLAWRVDPTSMLKGRTLQVPLYQLLAGTDSSVELIGIHPELDEHDGHFEFDGFDTDDRRESFLDTTRVLLQLRARGSFPFNKDDHCKWCPFTAACRRGHPPSVAREHQFPDGARYRELSRKSKTRPHG